MDRIAQIVRDDAEHVIARPCGALSSLVQAGVFHRHCRAPPDLLGEIAILLVERLAIGDAYERQGSERFVVATEQWDDEERAHAQSAYQLGMLGTAGYLPNPRLIDVANEERASCIDR